MTINTRRMHEWLAIGLAVATLLHATVAPGSVRSGLEAFPPAAAGMNRFVIELAHKELGEDDAFRVEIVVGKQMLTDGVNLYRLSNRIEPRTLHGLGYTYYVVVGEGKTIGTKMAPPEDAPMVEQFVGATPLMVRYNSRLPMVVYAPTGYQVRYRIWQADEVFNQAGQR